MDEKPIVIGLCGVTNSGKTTLSKMLKEELKNCGLVNQDDYFLPIDHPNHVFVPEVNHSNWELLSALDMDQMVKDVRELIIRSEFKFIIIEGFTFLLVEELLNLCDFKVFIDLPYEECWKRRQNRTYDPPDPPNYFELVVWPEAVKTKKAVLSLDNVIILDGTKPLKDLFASILSLIN